MSVQTQIDRISGNVSAALTAIADKGVTVPDGSNSDALHDLILSIEEGGGLPDGIAAMTTGTYTPLGTQSTSCTITHGLGVTPNFFIMFALQPSAGKVSSNYVFSTVYTGNGVIMGGKKGGSTSVATDGACYVGSLGSGSLMADTIKLNFRLNYVGSKSTYTAYPYYLKEHRWFAGVYA